MLRRSITVFLVLALLLSVSVSVFAVSSYDWNDYVVSTVPGVDFDVNNVFISSSEFSPRWNVTSVGNFDGSSCSFDISDDGSYRTVTLYPFGSSMDYLALENINLQSSLDIYVDCTKYDISTFGYFARYECVDAEGYTIGIFESDIADFSTSFGVISCDLSNLPEGTVGLRLRLISQYIFPAGSYTFDFLGISFSVLTEGTETPYFPKVIDLQDYVVFDSVSGDATKLHVSVPSENLGLRWSLLDNLDFDELSTSSESSFDVFWDRHDYDYWITLQVLDHFDITDIVDGSILNVKYNIEATVPNAQPEISSVCYSIFYYDINGIMIGTEKEFVVPDSKWFTDTSLNIELDKPDNAVSMSCNLGFFDIWSEQLPISFTLDLKSADFVCDIPTMVLVQKETGRTNKLLGKIQQQFDDFLNREPEPIEPTWAQDAEDIQDQEEDLLDQIDPDNVLNSLADMHLTLIDNLILYANAFAAITAIWTLLIDVPVIKVILYCSLLLGLLAALLGMGLSGLRSLDRDSGRKGD